MASRRMSPPPKKVTNRFYLNCSAHCGGHIKILILKKREKKIKKILQSALFSYAFCCSLWRTVFILFYKAAAAVQITITASLVACYLFFRCGIEKKEKKESLSQPFPNPFYTHTYTHTHSVSKLNTVKPLTPPHSCVRCTESLL